MENLKKGFELEYIPFDQISLSKINYIILDYLISIHLSEIFPEICSSNPNYYLTSERFKVFDRLIRTSLKNNFYRNLAPKPIFVNNIPIIINTDNDLMPALEMSEENIKKIVKFHYTSIPAQKEILDILDILSNILIKFTFHEKLISKK